MMHESEFWPVRRWAIFIPPHARGRAEARPFKSEAERDAWVESNPSMRQAVGKRHPVVKEWRQRNGGST